MYVQLLSRSLIMHVHLIHDQELKCAVNSARYAVHELERHLKGLQGAGVKYVFGMCQYNIEFCLSSILQLCMCQCQHYAMHYVISQKNCLFLFIIVHM